MTYQTRKDIDELSILQPSFYKIFMALMLSMLSVVGWIVIIKTGNMSNIVMIIYLTFTFLWVLLSGIIASFVIHISHHNRMARVGIYATVGFITLGMVTLIYAFFHLI